MALISRIKELLPRFSGKTVETTPQRDIVIEVVESSNPLPMEIKRYRGKDPQTGEVLYENTIRGIPGPSITIRPLMPCEEAKDMNDYSS